MPQPPTNLILIPFKPKSKDAFFTALLLLLTLPAELFKILTFSQMEKMWGDDSICLLEIL